MAALTGSIKADERASEPEATMFAWDERKDQGEHKGIPPTYTVSEARHARPLGARAIRKSLKTGTPRSLRAILASLGVEDPTKRKGRGVSNFLRSTASATAILKEAVEGAVPSSYHDVDAFLAKHDEYTTYLQSEVSKNEHYFHLNMMARQVAALSPCTCMLKYHDDAPHRRIHHGMHAVKAWKSTDAEFKPVCGGAAKGEE